MDRTKRGDDRGRDAETVTSSSLHERDANAQAATLPAGSPGPRGYEPGDQIDRFVVEGKLGEGGMGVVLVALDPTLQRRVAIKLLRASAFGSGDSVTRHQRLLREAQAMARLSHPNVVAVHEVGTVAEQVFVAMELVEGPTLAAWLQGASPSWPEIVARFVAAGRGLSVAHQAGIVHRDFKPDNVLIGADGRVRVTDFGLASTHSVVADEGGASDERSVEPALSSTPLSATLTHTGALMGTPRYMAPEQHLRQRADARADQFSFCVALYCALFGAPPFAGESYAELASSVTNGDLRDPPVDSAVPGWLVSVISRGLSTEPEDRFPSMDALLERLTADPGAARRRLLRDAALTAAFAAAAAIAAFLLLRGGPEASTPCQGSQEELAGVWDDSTRDAIETAFLGTARHNAADTFARATARLDEYAGDWVAMRTEACEATRIRREQPARAMDLRMSCLDRRLAELGALVAVFARDADAEIVDRAVRAVGSLVPLSGCADVAALAAEVPPPEDPHVRAEVTDVRSRLDQVDALLKSGKYQKAMPEAKAVLAAASPLGYPPIEARAATLLGRLQAQVHDAAAVETLERAARVAAEARDDALSAACWTLLLHVVGGDLRRYDEALALRSTAEAAVARAGNEGVLRADLDTAVGNVMLRLGRYGEARELFASALVHKQRALKPEDLQIAFAHHNLSASLVELGEYDAALEHKQRALAMLGAALGPEHAELAPALSGMGTLLLAQQRYADARPYLERALAIWENALGPDSPFVAAGSFNLGYLLHSMGEHGLARPAFARALAIREKVFGPEHPSLANPLSGLGNCDLSEGKPVEAIPSFERAVAILEARPGDPMELAHLRYTLGVALWDGRRNRKRAARLVRQARDGYAAAGSVGEKDRAEADAWLQKH